MRRVTVTLDDGVPDAAAWLLLPRPPQTWPRRFAGVTFDGIASVREVGAVNATQRAWLLRAAASTTPLIHYEFQGECGTWNSDLPDWLWERISSAHVRPSAELAALARELIAGHADEGTRLRSLITHAAEVFAYDHPEERFAAGCDAVPTVCGTARGSCVDINGYLLAMAAAVGLRGQYLAGYWFHPERSHTHDLHCWLAFEIDGDVQYWDVAHHLKWGVSPLMPGLNPAGGRRVLLSHGRGLVFPTPLGPTEVSHFAEPVWLLENGVQRRPSMTVRIDDQEVTPNVRSGVL